MNGFKKAVLATTAAMVLGLAANAQAILIDGFADGMNEIESAWNPVPDGSVSGPANQVVTDTQLNPVVTRTITVEATNSIGGGHVSALVDPFAETFQYSHDSQMNGFGEIKWNFTSTDLTADGSFAVFIDVISADLAGSKISMTLFDSGGGSGMDMIVLGSGPQSLFYNFANFAGADLTDVNMALLRIDGVSALDLTIDFVGTAVPEPTSLLLFGSGLVGLGYLARRKHQKA